MVVVVVGMCLEGNLGGGEARLKFELRDDAAASMCSRLEDGSLSVAYK